MLDPDALAPIARLMGDRRDRLPRNDLQTDRYDLVRSIPLWDFLTEPEPTGLGAVEKFGTSLGPPLHEQIDDELQLAQSPDAPDPPPVSIFQVNDPRSIVRTADASAPLLVSGDGEGLVDLAEHRRAVRRRRGPLLGVARPRRELRRRRPSRTRC